MESTRHCNAGFAVLAVFVLVAGCGLRSSEPPGVGHDRGAVPDLRGARILLLPPQIVAGAHRDLERELVFAITGREGDVDWVTPDQIRSRLDRSPELDIALNRLAVRAFLSGDLERFGDPLYGELYRLGVVEDADLALLPVEVRETGVGSSESRVEISASLLHLRTGRVLWFGVLAGEAGPTGSLASTASAAESLARRIIP